MKKFILSLMAAALMPVLAMAQCPTPTTATATVTLKRKIPGLLDGDFSVSATKKVHFAGGNLQYTKSTGKWKIMEHQYDVVETLSQNVGDDYASQDVVSLFGWGTSGWNNTAADATSVHYQPYATCNTNHGTTNNSYQYGPSNANVVGSSTAASAESWSKEVSSTHPYENYDWGVYNSSDLGAGWRTLTTQEWGYLLNISNGGSAVGRQGNRYAKATVHSVTGLIILPDGWTQAASSMSATLSGINSTSAAFTAISDDDWTKLEGEGAVFLPAAGYRYGTTVYNVGSLGRYWSSSACSDTYAYYLYFNSGNVDPQSLNNRFGGCAVRLVQDL